VYKVIYKVIAVHAKGTSSANQRMQPKQNVHVTCIV